MNVRLSFQVWRLCMIYLCFCAVLALFQTIEIVTADQISETETTQNQVDASADVSEGGAPLEKDLVSLEEGRLYSHFKLSSLRFLSAFISSMSMIVVSEFGDKTFFIAAIMSMRNSRAEVFAAAIAALALMTVLSSVMGFTLPNLLPPAITHLMATILFVFFGVKLLYDASKMDSSAPLDEMEEVEQELEKREHEAETVELTRLEGGPHKETNDTTDSAKKQPHSSKLFLRRFFSPVFIQCFTMTFLAEWGDRSQIATIALAAAKDPYGVTIGGIMGHAICTGIAVIGGKLLATKISERTISIVGGILFLIFAAHSLFYGE